MRSLEGRVRAALDYEGALDQDHEQVRHLVARAGLPLCGADMGDDMTPGGADCPACLDVADEAEYRSDPAWDDTCGECPLGADPYTCAETCPAAGGPA